MTRMAIPVFVIGLLSALLIPLDMAAQAMFITFDVPGSTVTSPRASNRRWRSRDSTQTRVILGNPTASCVRGTAPSPLSTHRAPWGGGGFTAPQSINPTEAITGLYGIAGDLKRPHAFLRAGDGTFTTFDAPRAGTETFYGTQPISINLTAFTGILGLVRCRHWIC
jgi:hypothetical protein